MMNSLKNTLSLEVKSNVFNFSCNLHRRLTIIRGDSGVGKTSLINIVTSKIPGISVKCSLAVKAADDNSWRSMLMVERDTVIFFDDLKATETLEFATVCKETLVKNNLYAVIINRDSLQNFKELEKEDKGHKYMAASISVSEIYNFMSDGTEHWLEHVDIPTTSDYDGVDCILSEDSGRGYEFFDTYLKNVIPASDGKSSIVSDVISLATKHSKVLIFLDLAAYGCHWESFCKKVLHNFDNVFLLPGRECFEHMLIQSNMLNNDPVVLHELADPVKYANRFISWEKYYEDLISRVTYGKLYRCTHGRHPILSNCYLENCSQCNQEKKARCDADIKDLDGDKFDRLFDGTEFSNVLALPRKDTVLKDVPKNMRLF